MTGVTRRAAVDCGTNSLRLLVADVDPVAGTLVDRCRRMEIVRLGQGVDRTGRLAPDALARTLDALRGFAAEIQRQGAESVRMTATSATRDAENRADFVEGVRAILGVEPEVVTGSQEAALSFLGATRELTGPGSRPAESSGSGESPARSGSRPGESPARSGSSSTWEPPYLVVDIGGGSTEFVLGTEAAESVEAAASVDIGCVRLTERHVDADPPRPGSVAAAVGDIARAMDRVAETVPLGRARTLVGLAGSVTTVTGIALGLPAYDPERIHHARLPAERVREVAEELLRMPRESRAALPVMHPGRVDVIAMGALVLSQVVDRLGCHEVVASEHDILDGIVWSQVEAVNRVGG